MQTHNETLINCNVNDVWQVIGPEFDQAHIWMSPVKHSYATAAQYGEHTASSAPVEGRVCELSSKPGGMRAYEIITDYQEEKRYIKFEVIPQNGPKLIPVTKNIVEIQVFAVGADRSRVVWKAQPELKSAGKFLSPVIKFGLGKAFSGILQELKEYCEQRKKPARAA